jgi:predicted RNA-binding protein YlqC (UPF0109 family)
MTPVELYTLIASALVVHPDSLCITPIDREDGGVLIHVTAHDEDYGKLIGSQGSNFRACDDLIQLAAIKAGLKSCTLEVDTRHARAALATRFITNHKWGRSDDARLKEILRRIADCVSEGEVLITARNVSYNTTTLSVVCNGLHDRGAEAIALLGKAIARNRGRIVCVEAFNNANHITYSKANSAHRR